MKSTVNRLVLIIGAFVLALMAIDGLIQLNRAGLAEFGYGSSPWVNADSAAALFMIGLIVGMMLGIGIFFGYLMWREKNLSDEMSEVNELIEEVSREEELDESIFTEDVPNSEKWAESNDPWERPVDWWKNADED